MNQDNQTPSGASPATWECGVLEQLGIERRLTTAADDKGFPDPFSLINVGLQKYVKKMVDFAEVHSLSESLAHRLVTSAGKSIWNITFASGY